ncbi:MAG: NAD(+) diphosphatase [Gammaproteobacteria bacterium]|nr:NAD(+) diphosphatase [Gammaproteobacteria bacterium]NND37748.1 NAD(+) diphosphatase [Gammaproteobacteria bacterium]
MDSIVFSGRYIDRCSELRPQPAALEDALARSSTRIVPVLGDQCLIDDERLAMLRHESVAELIDDPERRTFLGVRDDAHVFCVAVDDMGRLAGDGEFISLREASGRLPANDSALAAYARAMVAWQERHRHCGVCGSQNRLLDAGFVMECSDPDCRHRSFPRLDPAIIVLVGDGDRCLLGRQASWPAERFSTIAGFVEPGESLEDALRREVHEETNVDVGACRYLGSQPWPFPAAIMIGFHATANSTNIVCNDKELAEARWASRGDIADQTVILPPKISIAYRLIEAWFDDHDGPTLASLGLPAPPLRVPRPLDEKN